MMIVVRLLLPLVIMLLGAAEPEMATAAIPDGSMECGHDWWSLERSLYLDKGGSTAWLPAVEDPERPWHGALSLRIDNPRGDDWSLSSGDLALETGVAYVLSFSARSALPGATLTLSALGRERDDWGLAGSGSWAIGGEWTRCSLKLSAPRGHRWFRLSFGHRGDGVPATGAIWLDGIQLARGVDRAFDPPVIETGILEPARFYALDSSGPWPVMARVRNHGPDPRQVAIVWEVVDNADGERRNAGRTEALTIPASSTLAIPLEVSPRRRGSFDLRWQVIDAITKAPLAAREHGFALVDPIPPEARTGNGLAIGAQMGGGGGIRADWQARDWATRSSIVLRGCGLEDMIDYRLATGETWLRAWDFAWGRMEPEQGRIDWRATDLLVDACTARGMQVVALLRASTVDANPEARYSRVPAWAVQRWPPPKSSTVCPVPPEEWARHAGAIAARYRGRIAGYEIMNEPNLGLSAEEYLPYLRAAATTIRAADPAAQVIGMCATGDHDGQRLAFIASCANLGALPLVDAVSFHPYDSRQDCSPIPADRAISEMRQLLDRSGRNIPLWNTELFYLNPQPVPYGYWEFLWQRGPEVTRRHLTDLAGGVLRSACVESSTYCQRILAPGSWDDRGRKPVPNRHFVVLNTLARLAGGALPVAGGIATGPGRLHRYRRADGSPLAAVWSADPAGAPAVLLVPGGAGKVLGLDAFGNPAPPLGSGADAAWTVGRDPLYLLPTETEKERFDGLLATAAITRRDPWDLEAHGSADGVGDPCVVVQVRPHTDGPLNGQVTVGASRAGSPLTLDTRTIAADGGRPTTWSVAVKELAKPGDSLDLELAATPGGRSQSVTKTRIRLPPIVTCPVLTTPPTIDGVMDPTEWRGTGSFTLPTGTPPGGEWKGPEDCSATIMVGHRQGWLYLAALVQDDRRGQNSRQPESAWDRDSVELFVDLSPDTDRREAGYGGKGGQLIVGLPLDGQTLLVADGAASLGLAGRVRSGWTRQARGWTLELALPLDGAFKDLAPGTVLGFDTVINDADDAGGAKTRLFWAGSSDNWRDRRGLGRLVVR